MRALVVFTDGGCSGNPGPGAWAYVMRYGERLRESSGGVAETTNNRMELQAVIEALSFISARKKEVLGPEHDGGETKRLSIPEWSEAPVMVYTDSQYVRMGVTSWLGSWKRKGWVTADKKPVKNRGQWEELDLLVAETKAEFKWVAGHSGIEDNERCDTLVRARIEEIRGRNV